MAPSATIKEPSARPRLLALDWLRGIAVLVMAECHVFNAVLAPQYREASWFAFLNWLNGFVAPAFLMVSGGVIGINLHNRWQDVVTFGRSWGKLWRRIGQILIVAYLLHIPTPLLWQFFGPRGPHLMALWTKMDILQCVAGALSLIVLLVPVTRNARMHRFVCVALAIVALVSVPGVARWGPTSTLPRPLLNYLWPTDVGLFPLVPWAVFPLLGVWLGPAIFSFTTRTWEQSARAALAGIVFMISARFVPGSGSYDAQFVFARIGWILPGLAVCCWFGRPVRGTAWILQFGELSLWSYTVHLILVYGSGVSLGLDALRIKDWSPVRDGLPPWATLIGLAMVLFLTALVVRWRAKSLQRKTK
jgi:uncharacterized membrane protein